MNEYVRKNRSSMALQHQFYLNYNGSKILFQANIYSKEVGSTSSMKRNNPKINWGQDAVKEAVSNSKKERSLILAIILDRQLMELVYLDNLQVVSLMELLKEESRCILTNLKTLKIGLKLKSQHWQKELSMGMSQEHLSFLQFKETKQQEASSSAETPMALKLFCQEPTLSMTTNQQITLISTSATSNFPKFYQQLSLLTAGPSKELIFFTKETPAPTL